MKAEYDMTPKEFQCALKQQLDSPLQIFWESYTGFCIGGFFKIRYAEGKEFGKRIDTSEHHAIGFIRRKQGKTLVSFGIFPGLANPISAILVYLIFVVLFLVIGAMSGVVIGIKTALGAGIWVILPILLSGLLCTYSDAGERGKRQLKHFLSHISPIDTKREDGRTR